MAKGFQIVPGTGIGDAYPVFIIAEAGSNWRMGTRPRDLRMGQALIDVAVEAGADAVKFQTYRPETVYVENAGDSDYLAAAGIKESIRDIFADLSMPYDMVGELADYCLKRGIIFMSSAFSLRDFEVVDPHTPVHKIASYEITHVRLLEAAARSGKPLVLSTGASTLDDVAWAVDAFHKFGGTQLALMQCTAKYPSPPEGLNVRTIPIMEKKFGIPVGLSDHSRDPLAGPMAAVALGGKVIEKHYTLDNRLPGPDHTFALTPEELKQMVEGIRSIERVLGTGAKEVLPIEAELRSYARRSIQAIRPMARGEALREGFNFDILRPGKQRQGAHPKLADSFEGKTVRRDIPVGDGIFIDDVEF